MDINIRQEEEVTIFDIDGPVDLYHSSKLKDAVEAKVEEGGRKFIINLAAVEYIDSSGIGSLISSMQNLKKVGGVLALLDLTDPVKKVFKLTRLDGFFTIFDDDMEALGSFYID